MKKRTLKEILNGLYDRYNSKEFLSSDPLCFVWRFHRKRDREIVGLVASSLAYGHIEQIKRNVQEILDLLKPTPFEFVVHHHPECWEDHFADFKHRFNTGIDLANLFSFLKQMIDQAGSIESFFMRGYSLKRGLAAAIDSFSRRTLALGRVKTFAARNNQRSRKKRSGGVEFFFPTPASGSACKRMNLFLRWMVRKDNLDLGIWKGVDKSLLVIPVDTHIASISRKLGWTRRNNPSWKMALDVTESLKKLDPEDPVKYDFALCHNGRLRRENLSCC